MRSQICVRPHMKNGQDVILQMASGTRCSGQSKHTLPHAWLSPLSIRCFNVKLLIRR